MIKKLFKLFLGNTIASFGVVCLIKSGLGAFAITSANQTFASLFPISLGMAGFIVETEYTGRGLKGQFKSADRFHAHFSMILGDEEVKNEVVNMKCTHSKEQTVVPLENIVSFIDEHYQGGHDHE